MWFVDSVSGRELDHGVVVVLSEAEARELASALGSMLGGESEDRYCEIDSDDYWERLTIVLSGAYPNWERRAKGG